MSDGCPGCFTSQKGQARAFDAIYLQAKQKAIAEQQTYVVYKEGFEFFYTPAPDAIAQGVPIIQFVSQYP